MYITTSTEFDYDKMVHAGAAFLDDYETTPADWRNKLDIEILAMANGTRCIIGQLFGGEYCLASEDIMDSELFIAPRSVINGTSDTSFSDFYDNFTAAWVRYLNACRAA